MELYTATDFFSGQPKRQMVEMSLTFAERLIGTVCYTAQMYKVELSAR